MVDIDGEGWYGNLVYGGEGDDTFIVRSGFTDPSGGTYGQSSLGIYGGPGNDTFKQGTDDYGSILGLSATTVLYGNEGNDKFEKFINTDDADDAMNTIAINGGEGDDKIGGAANFYGIALYGEEGNDVIYGGEAEDMLTLITADLGEGDDAFFGRSGGYGHTVDGGDGNDKIFGPNNVSVTNMYGLVTLNGDAGDDIIDFGDYNDIH